MQNKGAIKIFAIAFALVSLFQLSFTYFAGKIEKDAVKYANTDATSKQAKELAKNNVIKEKIVFDSLVKVKETYFLDSMQNEEVFNFFWIKKYTFKECKDRELNLGLDLKGGMNVTLEISVVDIIKGLANNSKNPVFTKAIEKANEMEKTSTKDYVTLFGEAIKAIDPGFKLSSVFNTVDLREKINYRSTNEEVLAIIKTETDGAIDRTYNILRTRIDRFGVTQPNIQKLSTAGRILVELPGIKDPNRVRKLLQGTAKLEFWLTYEFKDVYKYLEDANKKLVLINKGDDTVKTDTIIKEVADNNVKNKSKNKTGKVKKDTTAKDTTSLVNKIKKDTTGSGNKADKQSFEEYAKENPLFAYLKPAFEQSKDGKYFFGKGPTVGYCAIKDTSKVNKMLALHQIISIFPKDLSLKWEVKPFDEKKTMLKLIAIQTSKLDGKAPLDGGAITDARQDYGQNNSNVVSMQMNSDGAKTWKRLTGANVGKCIAIVLDNYVYSAPVVQNEIPNGSSQITGNFSIEEAKDLANVLKAGKLPAPAKIVEEAIVGPTLGKEAITAGLWSFIVAFLLTLIFMVFYYNRAGLVADVALFTNMFFVFGILASLGAVLTLPGIAGIVLTIGMDVDKNVIIYERIREELRAGKGVRLAVNDGYKHAYSSIIDSNVTTLLTAIVLLIFGSGPVQGFATTLIIGIISSLFCAIFITKLIFIWMMDKNIDVHVWNKITKNFLTNIHIDFIGIRKTFYIVSLALVVIGIVSIATRGLTKGIDFTGGRTYVVRLDKEVTTTEIRVALGKVFDGHEPEVKTFGPSNQVKITTSYKIDDKSLETDSVVESKLFSGIKGFYNSKITLADFISHDDKKLLGRLSSQKVEPTIAYSLLKKSFLAVFFSLLIIFIYIALRFKKWQWGLGGVVSLFHDTFIVVAIFSLFNGILPFSLEIDQHFIAAILTIIGYSIMDSVIIFDRIREYQALYPKRDLKSNMNDAINSTLSRTLNTSGITFMVLLAMFIFGGEVIRGFTFALLIGIAIGTYSSVLNATPIAYDTILWWEKRKEKKNLLNGKK